MGGFGWKTFIDTLTATKHEEIATVSWPGSVQGQLGCNLSNLVYWEKDREAEGWKWDYL